MLVSVSTLARTSLGALFLSTLMLAISGCTNAQHAPPDSTVHWVTLARHADSTASAQLAVAVQSARREGRTPVVDLGAPWCGGCHVLDAVMRSAAMAVTMRKMSVIALNADEWQDGLAGLGFELSAIPRLFIIDTTGHPLGEPWRPRDVPDSLEAKLGQNGAWRVTTTDLFMRAQKEYAKHQIKP